MNKIILFTVTTLSILGCAYGAFAQNSPIEISADDALEWHRNEQQYIAKGNATATQNDTVITADTLTAHYTNAPQDNAGQSKTTQITKIIAQGEMPKSVVITTKDNVITGDRAVYTVKESYAKVTGETLTLTSEKMDIEASDAFEYWTQEQKFKASGHTKITEATRTLTADEVTAWFMDEDEQAEAEAKSDPKPDSTPQRLKEAKAIGHVVITTQSDTASGDTGHYDGIKEIVTLEGHVKIVRDKNILNGHRAIVNLKTGVSQLFGHTTSDNKTNGRVTGTFFPEKKE